MKKEVTTDSFTGLCEVETDEDGNTVITKIYEIYHFNINNQL